MSFRSSVATLLLGVLIQPPAQFAGPAQRASKVDIVDPTCAPGPCRCRGVIDSLGPPAENGLDHRRLRRGVDCLAADFDGDERTDLAIAGAEGMAVVLLRRGAGEWHIIKAMGLVELYAPRSEVGPHGEPPSERFGLFVRWVGQSHVVFLWNGERFTRTALPAWY